MSDSPYRTFGTGTPPMLGRERLFEELCHQLTKPTPEHVCVVGPRSFGKSVLLNHLASHFKDKGDHYVTSSYWDIRHDIPVTDDEFRRCFAKQIKDALKPVQPDLADYLELEDDNLQDLLHLVFEEMKSNGLRLIAILDGFDHILSRKSAITRNLWDQMRDLGQMTSLRFVTGSRRRLRELCRTEDSQTSDFWRIFYGPVPVGCFEENDWSGFLSPFKLRGVTFDSSARKEIDNWTGGVPVLAAALAERLFSEVSDGVTLSKPHVDTIAEMMVEERLEVLADLWDDCQTELKSDLVELADRDIPLSEVPEQRRRDIELRGFARSLEKGKGNKLRSSCRLMDRYAKQHDEVKNLKRLFGDEKCFESNIQSLLDLRLAQVRGADSELMGLVEDAIRELQPNPTKSVSSARFIAIRALDLIWKAELPGDKSLPESYKFIDITFGQSQDRDRLPNNRRQQCYILSRITGTQDHAPVSKFVTKPTSLLVEHLHLVGNFGNHMDEGGTVSVPIAAAFCMSAISLCESLARDLATPRDTATEEEG